MKLSNPVSIVMVAYTEEIQIERVILDYYHNVFQKLPKGSEFIVYLDCPPDNTPNIVKELAKNRKIKIFEGEHNLGYAGAMTNALKSSKNDIVFYSDSSGKHVGKDFWNMIKYVDRYDIITGLRRSDGDPLIRRILTFGQRTLISSLFMMPFFDFNTGYKIISREIIDKVLPKCKYMKQSFSSELLIRAYKMGYKIRNVPVLFRKREGKNTGTNYFMIPGIVWRSFKGFILLRFEMFK